MKINGIQGDAVKTMWRKNGFLYEKERLSLIERTAYSMRKNRSLKAKGRMCCLNYVGVCRNADVVCKNADVVCKNNVVVLTFLEQHPSPHFGLY